MNNYKDLLHKIRELDWEISKEILLLKYENMINALGSIKLANLLVNKGILTKNEIKKLDKELTKRLYKERNKIRKRRLKVLPKIK